jgi:hypothetical protein
VNLVLAILHVHQAAVLAIKEFGIALAASVVAGFFETETIFVAADHTGKTGRLRQIGDVLEHTVQLNVVVGFLLHDDINFSYAENSNGRGNILG